MSDPSGLLGVVVGHGDMPAGLVSAVRAIAGEAADALTPISNTGKSPEELKLEIDEAVGDAAAVVFVDLQSGSCGMAAYSCCRDRPGRAVLCGVNLPMLLDFVFRRQSSVEEIADSLVDKGRSAISRPLRSG